MNKFVQNIDSFMKLSGPGLRNSQKQKKARPRGRVWKEGGGLVNYQTEVKPQPFQIDEYRENILFMNSRRQAAGIFNSWPTFILSGSVRWSRFASKIFM